MKRLLERFRRSVKVEINCPHGEFIPSAYRLGSRRQYSCTDCAVTVKLTTFQGKTTW